MIFVKDTEQYATVWKVKPSENGKYIDLQISTSEKDKDGSYLNSSWFPRCIGHANNSLKDLQERDRIKIKTFKLTNEYNKEKNQSYLRFLILDAEILDKDGSSSKETTKTKTPSDTKVKPNTKSETKTNEEDLPW